MKKGILSALFLLSIGLLSGCSSSGGVTKLNLFDSDEEPIPEDTKTLDLMGGLPAVPTFSQVIEFEPETNNRTVFRYGVDPKSIKIDSGNIVRFSLFRVSDMGATNITYESIRCKTSEFRTIAIANADGTWMQAQNDDWRELRYRVGMYGQFFLLQGVFCQGKAVAGQNVATLQGRLKNWRQTSGMFNER